MNTLKFVERARHVDIYLFLDSHESEAYAVQRSEYVDY